MTNLESKRKFYMSNRDVFLRYFDSDKQYQALIDAGAFKKLESIIKEKSEFDYFEFEVWVKSK